MSRYFNILNTRKGYNRNTELIRNSIVFSFHIFATILITIVVKENTDTQSKIWQDLMKQTLRKTGNLVEPRNQISN